MAAPDLESDRFTGLWEQIAIRYADRPLSVAFELLNEPNRLMDTYRWNELLQRAWKTVRRSNPSREIIIGTAPMNDADRLPELRLPPDSGVTATVHYYEPMAFTHQGAAWVDGPVPALGTRWGSPADYARVSSDLEQVRAWSNATGTKVLVGEFGSYDRASLSDRAAWTNHVRSELDRLQLEWCYWDLTGDFGIYDTRTNQPRQLLLDALQPWSHQVRDR